VEDAVSATRAALEEGIVAGGGTVLVHAAEAIDDSAAGDEDEKAGFRIVRKALLAPLYWIAANAGESGDVVVSKVGELPLGQGFNAATGEYGDLIAAGVIDPVKVTRSAVEHAGSIAAMLLTTEALVVDKPEEEEDHDHGHGHSHHPGHTH
jgi:chaperonin GroEL